MANIHRSKWRNGLPSLPPPPQRISPPHASNSAHSSSAPGFRRVEEDVLIQRGLALFFAGKLRSAVLWRLFTLTGNPAAGEAAIASDSEGRNAWATMA